MAETGRARWTERVEQWRQSGLTARAFAAQAGLNAGTLCYWKWRLSREAKQQAAPRARRKRSASRTKLVELSPVSLVTEQVEIELANGCRLRVPASLDDRALTRLIEVVGGVA